MKEKELTKQELAKIAEKNDLVVPRNIGDKVLNSLMQKSEMGRFVIPNDYAVGNALAKGYIAMQNAKDFDKASKESKAEALLDMVTLGQYPDKHGYFIVYGNKMTWFQKYTGKMYTVNRALGIKMSAQPIYEDDDFTYEIIDGVYQNISHKQSYTNINSKKIVGAYAVAKTIKDDKFVRAEIMTMAQIKDAWSQATFKSAQNKDKFEEEFARRSVYNRLTKWFAETSNIDSELLDVARENENKHYDFEKSNVVPQDVELGEKDFEEKEEDGEKANSLPKHNRETGEIEEGQTSFFDEPDDEFGDF